MEETGKRIQLQSQQGKGEVKQQLFGPLEETPQKRRRRLAQCHAIQTLKQTTQTETHKQEIPNAPTPPATAAAATAAAATAAAATAATAAAATAAQRAAWLLPPFPGGPLLFPPGGLLSGGPYEAIWGPHQGGRP